MRFGAVSGELEAGTTGSLGSFEGDLSACGEVWVRVPSAEVLPTLPASEFPKLFGNLQKLRNHLDAYEQQALTEASRRNVHLASGDMSLSATLRKTTGVSKREAFAATRRAEKTAEQPQVAQALSAGSINAEQAEVLCDARVPEPVRTELVASAANTDTDATRRQVRAAERQHSEETADERFVRQRERRCVRLRTVPDGWFEGMVELKALLDPETGAKVAARLHETTRRLWRTQDKHDKTKGRRTPPQREADALTELICGHSQPSTGAAAAHQSARVQVLVTLDDLQHATGDAGTTLTGQTLTAETVRRLSCDAEIVRTVLDSQSRPLDVGRRTRNVPSHIRDALVARDHGCAWQDCDAPPSQCDAHHIQHWAHGGPTNTSNLVLLCHQHHQYLHEHHWNTIPNPRGEGFTFHPPPKPPLRL